MSEDELEIDSPKLKKFIIVYTKHSALNLGQLARDMYYFFDHPKAEKLAKEGSLPYRIHSLQPEVLCGA